MGQYSKLQPPKKCQVSGLFGQYGLSARRMKTENSRPGISHKHLRRQASAPYRSQPAIEPEVPDMEHIKIKIALVAFALVMIFAVAFVAVSIEQRGGYYECGNCCQRYDDAVADW